MTTVYILTFKSTGKKFCYTSQKAMSLSHTEDEFGISPNTVAHLKFKNDVYENNSIIVERFKGIGMGDIRKAKDKQDG